MKIRKEYLKKIILEETKKVLSEEAQLGVNDPKITAASVEKGHEIPSSFLIPEINGKPTGMCLDYDDSTYFLGKVLIKRLLIALDLFGGGMLDFEAKRMASEEGEYSIIAGGQGYEKYDKLPPAIRKELFVAIFKQLKPLFLNKEARRQNAEKISRLNSSVDSLNSSLTAIINIINSIDKKNEDDINKKMQNVASSMVALNQKIETFLKTELEIDTGLWNEALDAIKKICEQQMQKDKLTRGKIDLGPAGKGVQTTGTAAQMTATGAGAPQGKGGVERTIGNLEEKKKLKVTKEYLKRIVKEEIKKLS